MIDEPVSIDAMSRDGIRAKMFIYTSVTAFVTITACWAVALFSNLPSSLWCPPISLTGFLYPERAMYVIGFSVTFFIGNSAVTQLHWLSPPSRLHAFATRVLYVALVGMLGQAIVPFQTDTFSAEFPRDLKLQTIVHLLFAAVFFYGSQIHAILVLSVRMQRGNPLKLPWKLKTFYLFGNIICLYFLNSILPDSNYREGLSQRLGVLFILAFFADYSRDLRKISSSSYSISPNLSSHRMCISFTTNGRQSG